MRDPRQVGQGLVIRSDRPEPGTKIFAFGTPDGLSGTMTDGIISSWGIEGQVFHRMVVTANVHHGMSGGPIVDERGRIVGVVTAFHRSNRLGVAYGSESIAAIRPRRPVLVRELPRHRQADAEVLIRLIDNFTSSQDARSKFVDEIFDNGRDFDGCRPDGFAPIHQAVLRNSGAVEGLLKAGANPNVAWKSESHSIYPLMLCLSGGKETPDEFDKRVIHEIVSVLLKYGASPDPNGGRSSVSYARSRGLSLVADLIERHLDSGNGRGSYRNR